MSKHIRFYQLFEKLFQRKEKIVFLNGLIVRSALAMPR